MKADRILIVGANGQIGTALLPLLQDVYGADNVIASDIKEPADVGGIFEKLDATDAVALQQIITKHAITQIYHLAAVLSAKAEADPIWAWNINMQTLLNILEAGRQNGLTKIFIPSSIAVFGKSAPAINTPQELYLDPSTVYGVSKVAAENWINYYFQRYGLDIRSLRYPGVISYQSMAGGGTTDYAVDMYHKAIAGEDYTCFLSKDTMLPMIYITDALRATLELMEAPAKNITIRSSYNLAGISFTPYELYESIITLAPDFKCAYKPDFRQAIADSWPKSINDSAARDDWGWLPEFSLERMTEDMFLHLSEIYQR